MYTIEDFEQWESDGLDLGTIEETYGFNALEAYLSFLYYFVK